MSAVSNNYSVLLIEDDSEIARLLGMLLQSEGYDFAHIERGDQAVEAIREQQPDIVILDVMLPGLKGVEICRIIRDFYQGVVLMLTACEDDFTEISALNVGADDYLVKPVRPHVLLARLQSLLRRTQPSTAPQEHLISCGRLLVDTQNRKVVIDEKFIELTTAEYELLVFLAQKQGQIVSRDACFQALRGIEYDGIDRSMDMRFSALRKKLKDTTGHGELIKTVRGKGYLLVADLS